jgi:hypothetical protein
LREAPLIDVLIPTSRQPERLHNLVWQIRSAFNQGIPVRVTVAMGGEWPELMCQLSPEELASIRFVTNAPAGKCGNAAVQHCLETLEWLPWYYQTGDDDALLPWGLKHLYEAREGNILVVGRALCVSKKAQTDLTSYKVGHIIEWSKVSGLCALFKMEAIKACPQPWWNPESGCADFELIDQLSKMGGVKLIPNTITILALV